MATFVTNSTWNGTATVNDAADWAGDQLVYHVTVTNSGPNDAVNVTLMNPVPTNCTYASASAPQGVCGLVNGTVTCSWSTLASGSVATASTQSL